MTVDDLAAHSSTWDQPISTTYRGMTIWECPPNGQGLAALLGLNLLEGFDLAAYPALSTERLHLEIEAMRLAFADTRWYVADPAFNPAPLASLLSKAYADERRRLIDPERAIAGPEPWRPGCLFGHGLFQRRGWRGQRLLVHQQQLHGVWHRHRPHRMGIFTAKPRPQFQPGCKPSECPGAWQAPVPHDHPRHGDASGWQPVGQFWRDGWFHAAAGSPAGGYCAGRRPARSTVGAGPPTFLHRRWQRRRAGSPGRGHPGAGGGGAGWYGASRHQPCAVTSAPSSGVARSSSGARMACCGQAAIRAPMAAQWVI